MSDPVNTLHIAAVGTSRPGPGEQACADIVRALGRALPARGAALHTGACGGFPGDLADGFREIGGHVTGYSPGADLEDHIATGSPTGSCDELLFGFGGLIEREVALLRAADLVIVLGGNVGTLSELCMAVKMERELLIVDGLTGIGPRFPELIASLDVYPAPRVRLLAPDAVAAAVAERVAAAACLAG